MNTEELELNDPEVILEPTEWENHKQFFLWVVVAIVLLFAWRALSLWAAPPVVTFNSPMVPANVVNKPTMKAHWKTTPMYGGSENRYLVENETGKILIDIIHGSGPNDTWDVCGGDGSCDADYDTEVHARARGMELCGCEIAEDK